MMLTTFRSLLVLTGCLINCGYSSCSTDVYEQFEQRLDKFLVGTVSRDSCDIYSEITRLYMKEDERFCAEGIFKMIDNILHRSDGVDFNLHSFGWIYHHFWDHHLITPEIKAGLIYASVNIPLYMSYPGELGDMQYWSENHQIGWYAAEYLIGSAFASKPDLSSVVFRSSGKTGAYHAEMGKARVLRWLNFRLKFGFSEFNSDTYGPIAYRAVVSLVGCAPDQDVLDLATMVMNLQLYDHIIGSHDVTLTTARGRAYDGRKFNAAPYSHLWLVKGLGSDFGFGETGSVYVSLAVLMGRYTLPKVLLQVAEDVEEEDLILEERFGLSEWEDAAEEVSVYDADNCVFWFGNGGYFTRRHPRCLFIVGNEYDLWDRQDLFKQIKQAKPIFDASPSIIDKVGFDLGLGEGAILGNANMRTFRSKGIMLSSVQNYNYGLMGGQQHVWQATLDHYRKGTVFSLQPINNKPNGGEYWVGGILPKIGQFGSTLISIHSPRPLFAAIFGTSRTHAHFNHREYDEFTEVGTENGSTWLLGRQEDLYVALYSFNGGQFVADENGEEKDYISEGETNVYICEIGNKRLNSSFQEFSSNVLSTHIEVNFGPANDSLLECLVEHECMVGIAQLIDCLFGVCSSSDLEFTRKLKNTHEARDYSKLVSTVGEHLNQIKETEVEVKYVRSSTVFEFSRSSDLKVDGMVIPAEFKRYNNRFTRMDWLQRNISIEAGNYSLFMDFDSRSIVHS